MTYSQTIEYLFSKLPMYSRIGDAAYKKGFDNILALCEVLDNPQHKIKTIHIAGTNGKGSVSHMLASILQTQGYKTGLYTSPHLKDFRERIKINGSMISEAEVIDFTEKLKEPIETIQPSFFEITVAMAFYYFEKNNVDIAVIETGLGGRLDSTNIILPIISIITNIGLDHVQMLGNTLPAIAKEKAGIIKKNTPVVIGETNIETAPVFIETANENNSPLYFADKELAISTWDYDREYLIVDVSDKHHIDHKKYHLDQQGYYQIKNLLTVLTSCKVLNEKGFSIDEEAILKGLKQVRKNTGLHGRWEIIQHEPKIILDVAHNVDGMQQILEQLELITYHHLHIILGMVKDKDVGSVLKLLPKNATYYFTKANIPRAITTEELKLIASQNGLKGKTYDNVNIALHDAKTFAHKDDLILICGSVFLVGEVNN